MGVGLSSALQISASVHFAAEWADFGRGGEDVADLGPRPDRLAVSPPVLGGRRRETSLGTALVLVDAVPTPPQDRKQETAGTAGEATNRGQLAAGRR